ncbi:aldo/keto reductase [Streptomyces sp. ISL-43]|uniref:aldo/keto reductase n=1 Tax=Streptomyces sp. ISL-43 TaxID=2819183 RepID=UPI001BEA2D90|nr:aldo/keto reductase [Streptomyces sp. ISL-43]MBT2446702.1 aldo/keto reductase [Streptomyces sp. ISL-43]
MRQRALGRTGREVSVVGLGTWQLGGGWGDVREEDAFALLDASVAAGVTFFDTADEYGDGRSERLIGGYLRDRPDADVFVATKTGRRAEQRAAGYTLENFRAWTDRSRANLGVDTLDLVQLHCPPRVPLASGLLSGKYTKDTVFRQDDHRAYNRHGEAFDRGETFAGVDFESGVEAAAEFGALTPRGATPAQTALRWIIQQPGVTTVIPGARSPEQARANASATALPPLPPATLKAIRALYDHRIRPQVHHHW